MVGRGRLSDMTSAAAALTTCSMVISSFFSLGEPESSLPLSRHPSSCGPMGAPSSSSSSDCRDDNLNVFFRETFLPVLSENSPSPLHDLQGVHMREKSKMLSKRCFCRCIYRLFKQAKNGRKVFCAKPRTPCKWMTGSSPLSSPFPLKLLVAAAAAAIATTADIYQFFAVSSSCSAAAAAGIG